jgi:Na+/H+ antiporter NhaD/arsenite permease-like protein
VIVWVLSSFLDNIAGALIGGAMAHQLFRAKVHIGYLAGIVAASNAGGAWSVVGDTTTTMMWIAGVSPVLVFEAIIASTVALLVFGIPAAMQQQGHSPIQEQAHRHVPVDWVRVGIVALILVLAIGTNVVVNAFFTPYADSFPYIGVAVWLAILFSVGARQPDWEVLPRTFLGSLFLLALVLCATLMPVEKLPTPSWPTALGLGFLSAAFDNIPLTALAIKQGGYDWGFLAYTVGFGGSMTWFGSSAGVALCNMYPEGRSVVGWFLSGWHVALAYVIGFFVMLLVWSWQPDPPPGNPTQFAPAAVQSRRGP